MKLLTLQILQIFIECRNMVGASVHTSKHSLFRLKITVGCRLSAHPSIHLSLDDDTLKITVGCRLCWCCVDMCGVRVVCVCVVYVYLCIYVRTYVCTRRVHCSAKHNAAKRRNRSAPQARRPLCHVGSSAVFPQDSSTRFDKTKSCPCASNNCDKNAVPPTAPQGLVPCR